MKKILLICILCILPNGAFAELEFFLSSNDAPFSSTSWTSDTYPDSGAEYIGIKYTPSISPVPKEYVVVDTLVQEIFNTITTQSGAVTYEDIEIEQFETNYYETLISTENPQFIEYITTSINPETETIIEEKIENNIVLTPFEEIFYNCNISLSEREAIVLDVLERIDSGEIENLENISYSNPSFGDCIIPFPDISHRQTVIDESFSSNQLLAETLLGEQIDYKVHESIENLLVQEMQYQESVVSNDILFSEFFESEVISSSQYNLTQKMQEHYQEIVNNSNLNLDQKSIISQEYKQISDAISYHMEQREQGNMSQSDFELYMLELEKILQLQKYFSYLLASGDIDIEEYNQYTQTGLTYMQEYKNISQRYINSEINNETYVEEISILRKNFQDFYESISGKFLESYDDNTGLFTALTFIFYLTVICIVAIVCWLLYIRKKKTKLPVGE